jgi:MFS family permease
MYSGIPVLAAGMLLLSQTQQSYTLLLTAVLLGFAVGAIQPSTQTIIVKMTPQHRLGLANSTYFMCADLGMAIGPTLAGLAVPVAGFRGMYLGMTILAALGIVMYYFAHGKKTGKQPLVNDI